MTPPQLPATRGRPRTITRERIVEAGIKMGLPSITFVGVAAALGVSHMALYKHVANLEALKSMVAEEIFTRWQIPQAGADQYNGLKDYMMVFATSVRVFVKAHPGLTPYVIRRLAATQPMLAKSTTIRAISPRPMAFQKSARAGCWRPSRFTVSPWPIRCIR